MSDQDISFGPFRLIASRGLLLEGDRPLHIGSRALTILQVLLERAGEIVEKKELARLVWPNTFVDEANIRVHIAALRRALGDGQNGERYIVNVPGRGYSFAGSVSRGIEARQAARVSESDGRPSGTLPNFITRLVGRTDAVAKLKTELTRERVVTIVGPGGIGKTSLALAATPSWVNETGYEVRFADLATDDTVRIVFVEDKKARSELGALIVEATARIIGDPQMSADSARWFRTGRREIAAHRDGVTVDTAGLPPFMTAASKLLPDLDAASADRYWLSITRETHVSTAPVLGMLLVRDRLDAPSALQAGRAWQRLHLAATAEGLAAQPLNQPVECIDRDAMLGRADTFGSAMAGGR